MRCGFARVQSPVTFMTIAKESQMRRILVLGIAGLLSIVPQIKDAAARGGFGGGGFHGGGFGGFHGGGLGGFHGGGFGGFHGGAGFGGFHGGFARAGFAPGGFVGGRPGWHGGGIRWAGGWHPGWGSRPGWGWHRGSHPWLAWRRPAWRWAAAGALGFTAYDAFGYDCPLTQRAVWDGFSYHIVWIRSCDSYW